MTPIPYMCAICAGALLHVLGAPLAWMIGPLVAIAGLQLMRVETVIPPVTRPFGQLVIASTVGMTITPETIRTVGDQLLPMVGAAFLTLCGGFVAGLALARIARIDVVAASLACVPGGPVEMASIAQRLGLPPGPVVFAQTLRIVMLVVIIPPILLGFSDLTTADAAAPVAEAHRLLRVALLLGLSAVGGYVFVALRLPNPFFLGAMAMAGAATSLGLPVDEPPLWLIVVAQILLGMWLGRMIDRALFVNSPRYAFGAVCSTAMLMAICAGVAVGLMSLVDTEWQTMILATAPGGLTEMSLTAGLLHQSVVIVTAYQVVRIAIVLTAASPVFRLLARAMTHHRDTRH